MFGKEIKKSDKMEYFLELFKKFQDENDLEIKELEVDKYGYDRKEVNVSFEIKDDKKIREWIKERDNNAS